MIADTFHIPETRSIDQIEREAMDLYQQSLALFEVARRMRGDASHNMQRRIDDAARSAGHV